MIKITQFALSAAMVIPLTINACAQPKNENVSLEISKFRNRTIQKYRLDVLAFQKRKHGKQFRYIEMLKARKAQLIFIDSLSSFFYDTTNFYTDSLVKSCSFSTQDAYMIRNDRGDKIYIFLSRSCEEVRIYRDSLFKLVGRFYFKKGKLEKLLSVFDDP